MNAHILLRELESPTVVGHHIANFLLAHPDLDIKNQLIAHFRKQIVDLLTPIADGLSAAMLPSGEYFKFGDDPKDDPVLQDAENRIVYRFETALLHSHTLYMLGDEPHAVLLFTHPLSAAYGKVYDRRIGEKKAA